MLGVERLEQGRGRITAEVAPYLVDLVEDEYRIGYTGPGHALDDPSRHRPHIGAAVTTNFSLIPDSAQ